MSTRAAADPISCGEEGNPSPEAALWGALASHRLGRRSVNGFGYRLFAVEPPTHSVAVRLGARRAYAFVTRRPVEAACGLLTVYGRRVKDSADFGIES